MRTSTINTDMRRKRLIAPFLPALAQLKREGVRMAADRWKVLRRAHVLLNTEFGESQTTREMTDEEEAFFRAALREVRQELGV